MGPHANTVLLPIRTFTGNRGGNRKRGSKPRDQHFIEKNRYAACHGVAERGRVYGEENGNGSSWSGKLHSQK